MMPLVLIAAAFAFIALTAWAAAALLESSAAKFYRASYPSNTAFLPDTLLAGSLSCPYCKSAILMEDAIIACNECKTLHHYECWESALNCSVYGCEGIKGTLV